MKFPNIPCNTRDKGVQISCNFQYIRVSHIYIREYMKQWRKKQRFEYALSIVLPLMSVIRRVLRNVERSRLLWSFVRMRWSRCRSTRSSGKPAGRTRAPWRHRRCSYLLVEFFLRPSYGSQLCKFHLSEVAR